MQVPPSSSPESLEQQVRTNLNAACALLEFAETHQQSENFSNAVLVSRAHALLSEALGKLDILWLETNEAATASSELVDSNDARKIASTITTAH